MKPHETREQAQARVDWWKRQGVAIGAHGYIDKEERMPLDRALALARDAALVVLCVAYVVVHF